MCASKSECRGWCKDSQIAEGCVVNCPDKNRGMFSSSSFENSLEFNLRSDINPNKVRKLRADRQIVGKPSKAAIIPKMRTQQRVIMNIRPVSHVNIQPVSAAAPQIPDLIR